MSAMQRGLVCAFSSAVFLAGCSDALTTVDADSGSKPVIEDYDVGSPDKPESSTSAAIVNGSDASAGEYPWAVYAGGCGGTLIGEEWVMTAAHCASEFGVGAYVNIGGLNVSAMVQGSEGEWRQVAQRSCHSSYQSNTEDYDYCLVRLSQPSNQTPVSIDTSGSSHAGTNAVVVGWGTLYSNGPTPDRLQEATVPVLDQSTCNQAYGGEITNRMMCAGYLQGGIDSCQGDSGGPLVSAVTGQLIGVVSWGYGCAEQGYPGVYARISEVTDWICDTTDDGALGCAGTSEPDTGSGDDSGSDGGDSGGSAGGDTGDCGAANPSWIGDGYCDGGEYNTEACGYDGGDCCAATCVPGDYACGSNGYDCVDEPAVGACTAPRPDWIGDGYCDRDPAYNNEACGYDGGDCCEETCQDSAYGCGANGYQCLDSDL